MIGNGSLLERVSANITDCVDLPDNSFQPSKLPFAILQLFLMVWISFGNSLIMVAVYKFHELRTSTNIFVVNLAISDLLVGIVTLPLHVLLFLVPSLKVYPAICLLRYTTVMVSCGVSGTTLLLISVDRYVAIHKPYQYSTLMSMPRSIAMCGVTWVILLVYGSMPFFGFNTWEKCQDCTFTLVLSSAYIAYGICLTFAVLVVMAVLYGKIFITANQKAKEIRRQTIALHNGNYGQKEHTILTQNTKAAKTLGTVYGLFAFCFTPFAIFLVWEIGFLDQTMSVPAWVNIVRISTSLLVLLNSGLNPLIYHTRSPQFRKSFRKLLRLKPGTVDTLI